MPYFEVLPELTVRGAQDRAAHLLDQRIDGVRAEVWEGDTLVFTLPKTQPAISSAG